MKMTINRLIELEMLEYRLLRWIRIYNDNRDAMSYIGNQDAAKYWERKAWRAERIIQSINKAKTRTQTAMPA